MKNDAISFSALISPNIPPIALLESRIDGNFPFRNL